MSYSVGQALAPITITSANNVFVFTDNVTQYTVTINAGTYFLCRGSATNVDASMPGLYYAIEDVIAGNTTFGTRSGAPANIYTFSESTPVESTGVTNGSVKLVGASGGGGLQPFSIDFNSGSFTMDPTWFGFPEGHTTQESDSGGEVAGDRCVRGRWIAYGISGVESPLEAASFSVGLQSFASPNPIYSEGVDWGEYLVRPMVFDRILGAHIFRYRANEQAYASNAGLATGDNNNAFYWVWTAARAAQPFIWAHNTDSITLAAGDDWEVVKFLDAREIESMIALAPRNQPNGDIYDMRFRLFVDTTSRSPYGH